MSLTPASSADRRSRATRIGTRAALAGALVAGVAPAVAPARTPAPVASGAAACANAALVPTAYDSAQVGGAILCLVNAIRAQHGLTRLIAIRPLSRAAVDHSRDMVVSDYFAHITPSGRTPEQRMRRHGMRCGGGCALGENIAWASGSLSTPAAIVQAWMASPGHRANILERAFRYAGVGVWQGAPQMLGHGRTGTTVTEDFAS